MHTLLLLAFSASLAWSSPKSIDCADSLLAKLATADFVSSLEKTDDFRKDIATILTSHSPLEQLRINAALTSQHANREMSFQTKNEVTGNYDRFVAVPVNGVVAPIRLRDFNRLVRSTAPVMKTLRSLLQKIYSVSEMNIENLGLQSLPPEDAALALKVIRESIYFEPQLVHPNMAEYPFLTVGAFDGAVVDPAKPEPSFFEMNLGTPSGLSNNIQLVRDVRRFDRKLGKLIERRMPKDETFVKLRMALESNAFAWTKRANGITVVISPGIYNGAHPDVAEIARETGLPLVKSSDLYEDSDGNIRLNTGRDLDPYVTGIYGRMEESFFLQSSVENIPMITPSLRETNLELGRRLGLNLRPGAIYQYVYDEKGQVTDVARGENKEPLLSDVWDTIGLDPHRPAAPRGSFARAIRNRKLYYSGLGGRVVDDKRLFRIISDYLVPNPKAAELARPIRGLSQDDFSLLYAHPEKFVVKEPNNSGGSGIFFPRAMEKAEVEALMARVRRQPDEFEVQYVSTIATLPQATRQENGDVVNEAVPLDLRLFVMMGADGEVDAGVNSLLLRTGARGGLYTNTSRGGGYGVAIVLGGESSRADRRSPDVDLFLSSLTSRRVAAASRDGQLTSFVEGLKDFYVQLGDPDYDRGPAREEALRLSFAMREVMDLLSSWNLGLASELRGFAQGELVDKGRLGESIMRFFENIKPYDIYDRGDFKNSIKAVTGINQWLRDRANDPLYMLRRSVPAVLEMRPLPSPEVTYEYKNVSERVSERVEIAEYLKVGNPEIQAIIDEVRAAGGQVRLLKRRSTDQIGQRTATSWTVEAPYFWLNLNRESPSYLIPVIGIDLGVPGGLPALRHELEHFRVWKSFYDTYVSAGLDHEMASREAVTAVWTDAMQVLGERRAVAAEMQAEEDFPNHPFALTIARPRKPTDLGYVNRLAYPEFEAVRQQLRRHKEGGPPPDQTVVRRYMRDMVTMVMQNSVQENDRSETSRFYGRDTIFNQLAKPYGIERLNQDGTVEEFKVLLRSVCEELNVPAELCVGYVDRSVAL